MKLSRIGLVFVISTVLVATTLVVAPSNAAIKAGVKCAKAGVTSVNAEKRFTCVKSGKRLIWSKGVAVKINAKRAAKPVPAAAVPAPKPSPISTESPAATPSPQPSPTTKQISFTPWAAIFVTEDMTNAALAKTSEYFGNVTPSNSYEITIDSAITDSDRAWITRSLDYANGAFSRIERDKMRVFLGTSHDWSARTMRGANVWIGDLRQPFPCSNGINDVYCADKNLVLMVYSDIYAANSFYRWDVGRRSTPAHEVFHTVQYTLGGQTSLGITSNPQHIPRWLMEGSANYFGYYVVDRLALDSYETGRRQQVNTNSAYRTVVPLVQYDNFNSDPYGIGQAASEYLIASVGFENFLNIWRYTKSESSFSRGFAKAIGIELSDFYTKFEAARGSMKIGTQ